MSDGTASGKKPIDVHLATVAPEVAAVVQGPPADGRPHPDNPAAAPALTTAEEDRTSLGQRQINKIWEYTQAAIAITVTFTGMIVAAILTVIGDDTPGRVGAAAAALVFITSTVNLVIGFYFGRTNHTRTGGVGDKGNKER